MAWQIQQAKNRFSELIELARHEGPQTVTRHGQPVAEVVAIGAVSVVESSRKVAEQRMTAGRSEGFAQYLLGMPRVGTLAAPPRKSRKSPLPLGG